jgi:hypothetical protein
MRHTCAIALLTVIATACGSDGASSPLLAEVDEAERIWQALEEEHGSTYWYSETSCGQGFREITRVQVTDGGGALVSREYEGGEDQTAGCTEDEPYRYESWGADTLPEMFEECRALIRYGYDTTITFDDDGVLKSCRALDDPSCNDACDHGWHIAERAFGLAL